MNFAQAYRGRRVLVTGHTGFKGSWLSLWLRELGAEVTGFALAPPPGPSHFQICDLPRFLEDRLGDVRDTRALTETLSEARPEIVFHLAAQALVRDSYDAPQATFEVNVGGTVNVLEAVRHCEGVRAVVVVTSDKCYENRELGHAYAETDMLGGHDPYSASKAAAELVVSAYRRSFFSVGRPRVRVASVRAGNVIGGGDWGNARLVPDCVRALTAGRPIVLRNPRSVRPWQHVLEPISGYLHLGARLLDADGDPAFEEAFNFGPLRDQHRTVEEIARGLVRIWGSGAVELAPSDGAAPHEAHLLHLDCAKAARVLGWHARLDVDATARWTAAWYHAWHADGEEAAARTSRRQITEYQRL